jgi:hypothetical protein
LIGTGKLSDEVTGNEETIVPDLAKDVLELKKAVTDLLNSLSSTKQSYLFVPRSCREIYLEFPFSSSDRYIIDPDGLAGDPPIGVHCNMESGGNEILRNFQIWLFIL